MHKFYITYVASCYVFKISNGLWKVQIKLCKWKTFVLRFVDIIRFNKRGIFFSAYVMKIPSRYFNIKLSVTGELAAKRK